MQTKQTIAIIGATGKIGAAIAKSLASDNFRLLLKSNSQYAVEQLVNEIRSENEVADVEAVVCATDAGWEADIIILAVPYAAVQDIAAKIKEVANQKIVVSMGSYVLPNAETTATVSGNGGAAAIQQLLPYSKVVHVIYPSFAAGFNTPVIVGQQADAFLVGNDGEALFNVSRIISAMGCNPIIADDLIVGSTMENRQLS